MFQVMSNFYKGMTILALTACLGFAIVEVGNALYITIAFFLIFFIAFILYDIQNIFYAFLVILPLSASPFISQNLFDVTGLKSFNILALAVLALGVITRTTSKSEPNKLNKKFQYVLLIYIVMTIVPFVRSLGYFNVLQERLPDLFYGSKTNYFMSFFLKPSFYLVPLIYMFYRLKTERDLRNSITFVCIAFFVSSLFLVYSYFTYPNAMSSKAIWVKALHELIGTHYNVIAGNYLIVMPLLIYKAIRGNLFHMFNLVLAIAAVAVLQSRTAYFLLPFAFATVFWITGFRRMMPFLVIIAIAVGPLMIPEFIIKRASFGIESESISKISAGRVDDIWLPLLFDQLKFFKDTFIGVGTFSIVASPLWIRGVILPVTTPHSAYLHLFMCWGLIGVGLLIWLVVYTLSKLYRIGSNFNSELSMVMLVSFSSFLISGATGNIFFPGFSNTFLFVLIGITVVHLRVIKAV